MSSFETDSKLHIKLYIEAYESAYEALRRPEPGFSTAIGPPTMAARVSIKSFLATARKALGAGQRSQPLNFVVGNESADLDSLCSAVLLAYLRTCTPPHKLHIPLSNLPRADLGLRTEMTAVLRHAGLAPSDLITLSELPDLSPGETQWLLVDHNALTGSLAKFSERVIGCVDHHVDESSVPMNVTPRLIEPCGSCTSLVVEAMKDQWRSISDGDTLEEDRKLVKLALAPILIDTINMTAKEKVRKKDEQAVDTLKGIYNDTSLDSTAYFDEISKVKEDISELGFRDIFRKDYKEWQEHDVSLGISSVVQDLSYLVEKADKSNDVFLKEISRWAEERQLDVVTVMTTSNDGEFHRDLIVWGCRPKGRDVLERFSKNVDELQLKPWKDGALDESPRENIRMAWSQGNLAASRKQVAPMLRDAMKQTLGVKI